MRIKPSGKTNENCEPTPGSAEARIAELECLVKKLEAENRQLKSAGNNGSLSQENDMSRAGKTLEDTTAILHTAMDCSSSGIAIADAQDGKLRYVNRAGLEIHGGSIESAMEDVDISSYVKTWKILNFDGTPLDEDEVPLTRAIRYGETCDREFLIRRPNGEDRTVWASAAPVKNDQGEIIAGIVVFPDITELKKAEETIRKLARYPKENPNPVFSVSADGTLLYANEGCSELMKHWGCGEGSRIPDEYVDKVEKVLKSGVTANLDAVCGDQVFALVFSPIEDCGQVNVYGMDVTERLRAEKDRMNLALQLRQSQKLEAIGTLASGVAHEINNPIMGIMNYAELIEDEVDRESKAAKYLVEIGNETRRIARIVKNLLAFAREDKKGHSPARMSDIVAETLSLVKTVIRHDDISIEVRIPESLPKIDCRSQQIQQVMMNLLTNSRDALNERYEGYDENKKILIESSIFKKGSSSWLRTTVKDYGVGVTAELSRNMFDPFYTTKTRDKGTGLGLSISYGIVSEHGGELSVESDFGRYTCVHVDLPVAEGNQSE